MKYSLQNYSLKKISRKYCPPKIFLKIFPSKNFRENISLQKFVRFIYLYYFILQFIEKHKLIFFMKSITEIQIVNYNFYINYSNS